MPSPAAKPLASARLATEQAVQADEAGDSTEALELYTIAIEAFFEAIKLEPAAEHRTLMSFEVRDAHAAYEALRSEGVPCQSEPVEFPNCVAFVTADPDGHPIEIIRWKGNEEPYRIPSSP